MQPVTSAVIAAAGLGSRLGAGMPKCLIEIEGRNILTRLVDILSRHVSAIHVVIGYREELVVEYCARHHRDVVLVRNPDYRTTNTAQSFALGAQHLSGKTLFLDGDLLLSATSVAGFIDAAASHQILVGLTDPKSENTVYASGATDGETIRLNGFSRTVATPYEWANIVSGPSTLMDGATNYVFERLIEHLPLPGRNIELAEVDTAADLQAALKSGLATRY